VPDFVGRFVTLDRQDRGHCPFHDDQHQGFQVSSEGNFWHCYAGCGGVAIVDFWMKWRETQGQDGSFTEAVKELHQMLLG
jgi:DNA primase